MAPTDLDDIDRWLRDGNGKHKRFFGTRINGTVYFIVLLSAFGILIVLNMLAYSIVPRWSSDALLWASILTMVFAILIAQLGIDLRKLRMMRERTRGMFVYQVKGTDEEAVRAIERALAVLGIAFKRGDHGRPIPKRIARYFRGSYEVGPTDFEMHIARKSPFFGSGEQAIVFIGPVTVANGRSVQALVRELQWDGN